MKSHFLKENDVVLSSRWQFQDGRSKGMGTEWDQEVVGKVVLGEGNGTPLQFCCPENPMDGGAW